MSLYFILLLGSFAVPFLLSFDKKLHFYTRWKEVLPSIFIVAAFYIVCDIFMTKWGVWGFNPDYISNVSFFKLPIEEWLFFVIIPYASIFLHASFVLYFPNIRLSKKLSKYITAIILILTAVIIALHFDKIYTVYIFSTLMLALLLALFDKTGILEGYYITFLLILIPFLIVNAVLTGSFIESEVVWYNDSENLGIRVLTIPIEDFGYAFSLILFNLLLIGRFQKVFTNKAKAEI
jgi:lycopene cyclase domain-containing protein